MTNSTSGICPFTLKSLSSTELEDVAVIYASNPLLTKANDGAPSQNEVQCGHSCTLSPSLISYLHDSSGTKQCPVCQESPANVVCDIISSAFLINHDGALDNNNGRVISFRYGNISYYLWVYSTESIQSSSYYSKRAFSGRKRTNALHRIGDCLDIKFTNIKILYKGKILHPSTKSESLDDISEQLLDISTADILHKRKKPSLVVMGLRRQIKTMEKKQSTTKMYTIASKLNPITLIWNVMRLGLQWTFYTTKSVFGGLYLFVYSLLYPPQQTQ